MSRNNNKGTVNIDNDVHKFAKMSFKKFKKANKDEDYSKKELKSMYYLSLLDLLPEAINFCIRYGHIQQNEVQEVKDACYAKFIDDELLKAIRKALKSDDEIDNIRLFPIITRDILEITARENRKLLESDPNAKKWDMSSLVETTQVILKKRLKKFAKKEIDAGIAFDIACIIPNDKALSASQHFRIKEVYNTLYETAKSKVVPINAIMSVIVKNTALLPGFVIIALLEKKERYGQLTDSQKTLYVDITNWALRTLENFDRETIRETLSVYVNQRKKAESQGKDGKRRYDLSSLSEVDYPHIVKCINAMVANNASIEKYL